MITKTKAFRALFTIVFTVSCVLIASLSFAQQAPPPGTIINKNNYKKYSGFFPTEWAAAFNNGFDGLIAPLNIKVAKAENYQIPQVFLNYSAKNKGKYSIAANGEITPPFNQEGLPFPDLKKGDKDFATKLMWNYYSKYYGDDYLATGKSGSYEKRRGEPVRFSVATNFYLFFTSRMVEKPKPDLPNPLGLYKAFFFRYLYPESVRNTITLTYRYIDENKPDTTFVYLPSMRRVIRAEASQRSTPVMGSVDALDDFNIFDGRTPDYTYKLVREQKVLAVPNSLMTPQQAKADYEKNVVPVDTEGYQVRDCYVIDIIPKDPTYPQSRKRIWVDKDTLWPYYGVAWDRAGKVWKVWMLSTKMFSMPHGEKCAGLSVLLGADLQFGEANAFVQDLVANKMHYTYNDVTPQAMLKAGE